MESRRRVAREAAFLLYRGVVEEYKQAKEMAAESLGVKSLPSNFEVAVELDDIAEELEGDQRRKQLSEMRRTALELMERLNDFHPRLIGSVWRGTVNHSSDIDIVIYSQDKGEVMKRLKDLGEVEREETGLVVKSGTPKTSEHFHLRTTSGYEAEIVVRPPEEEGEIELCDIYGDPKTGLSTAQLKKVLEEDPLRRFLPSKRR
jgi:hypothetical protein